MARAVERAGIGVTLVVCTLTSAWGVSRMDELKDESIFNAEYGHPAGLSYKVERNKDLKQAEQYDAVQNVALVGLYLGGLASALVVLDASSMSRRRPKD